MTNGTWLPRVKRNIEFIHDLRALWRRLQRVRPGEVTLVHVRSHIGIVGNETAGWLAGRGTREVSRRVRMTLRKGLSTTRGHERLDADRQRDAERCAR